MFVRLAFAVAINIEPEILIVDEALSVGDVFFQAKCYRKFEEFKKMGKTILFVSHDLVSINQYCDRAILLNKGHKVKEGQPKEIIDIYKKILVNQYNENEEQEEKVTASTIAEEGKLYKEHMTLNPDVVDYGNGCTEIVDFAILDKDGMVTNMLESGDECTVLMKVKFNKTVKDPIFAYTIKDTMGVELIGTNSMYEKLDTGTVQAGEVREIRFTQKWCLQKGEFLLALGCTGFEKGEFVVYSRLYDVCSITVLTDEQFVGKWNTYAKVTIK
jgi:teichoic acid transport system ATP-binding protein